MAFVHDVPAGKSVAARLLTTDFCPWANRFLYWLKEPVGWFVLATLVSVIIGLYFAPIGWMMAASLSSIIAIGMVWPAIAVRAVNCRLRPANPQVHEGALCDLKLLVQNRLPIPVWGLAVEGFLDRRRESVDSDATEQTVLPTVALAFIRGWTSATYRFSIRPELRGYYPDGDVLLTCSFPFGIWTAKCKFSDISPVTVWPKVYPISGQTSVAGRQAAEVGDGNRSGRIGDFNGLREYRHGDCLRQVNWVATARTGQLVVTQRTGPQCPSLHVIVDVANFTADSDRFADRIRVAASVLANLHQSSVPLRLHVGKQCINVRRGWDGFVQMMDELAKIPVDGLPDVQTATPPPGSASITIASNKRGDVTACISNPGVNRRIIGGHSHRLIDCNLSLQTQLLSFWTEARDASLVT